ncbi:MAG TPA: ATP-grasp domain-containing protein, partial [Chloroflexota bacterium]|nr:ATP-grasp domain-containing protein [Chloroflexota bacterium]
HRVIVASSRRHSLAGSSRYATHTLEVPDPLEAPEAFTEALVAATHHWRPDVVLPVTDAALRSLLPVRESLAGVVPFGPAEVVRRAANKPEVLRVAETLGFQVPRQILLSRPDEATDSALASLSWPIVVKPGSSVSDGPDGQIKLGVSWASDVEHVRAITRSLPASAFPVLLQERVDGPGTGVFLLRWDGRTLAAFAHERIREKPPSGGVSVCSVSVTPDRELVAHAEALLAALEWQGPAMVECKRDARTGTPYLMEVNGRFWGSLQLAVDAGVDFPRLLVDAALGRPPSSPPTWLPGVRMRWWWGEVDHVIACLRHSELAEASAGARLAVLRTFLFPGRGTRNEVLRRHDPMPALRETIDWFASIRRRP